MANHDQYDKDILKQLTRIANGLDKIERKMSNNTFEPGSGTDVGIKLGVRVTNCKDCQYYSGGKEECITKQSKNVEHIQFEGRKENQI